MAEVLLSVEIGSTYTKLAAFSETGGDLRLLGRWATRTTLADVRIAVRRLMADARDTGIGRFADLRLTSSAAGGLRIAVCGLTPTLSTKVGLEAALGAGGIVVHSAAGRLDVADIPAMMRNRPGIVLICGGTESGERAAVLANVAVLAKADADPLFVFAGNSRAAVAAEQMLADAGKRCVLADNLYPETDHYRFDGVRELIRAGFERDVVKAPGLAELQREFGTGCLPTPLAVSSAVRLMGERLGGLLTFDVGGATTDVHSYVRNRPAAGVLQATAEPELKRTVEGDLGVFYNLANLLDESELVSVPREPIAEPGRLRRYALRAVARGLARHCGRIVRASAGAMGRPVVYGADLRPVRVVLATGGALRYGLAKPRELRAVLDEVAATRLVPEAVSDWLLDRHYLMSSLGSLLPERELAVTSYVDRTLDEGEWC